MTYVAVILAHPNLENSHANRILHEEIQQNQQIKISHLYAQYPDFVIDVPKEQALIQHSEAIVLQFPVYWYSSPALLKEWIDQVFTEGFAYGDHGVMLQDKPLFLAVTLAAEASFCSEKDEKGNPNLFALSHTLLPFESLAVYCGMKWAGSFAIFGAEALSVEELGEQARLYRQQIESFL